MDSLVTLPYLDLIWDPDSRALISQWKGGMTGRRIKEGLDAGLAEFIRRRPRAQWIGDTTDIGTIPDDEKAWIDSNWFPRFLATGVEFMAVVMPSSAVAKLSVKNVVSKVEGTQLTIFNCATLDEARDWMKKQKF
jgi:hypothetical protein